MIAVRDRTGVLRDPQNLANLLCDEGTASQNTQESPESI